MEIAAMKATAMETSPAESDAPKQMVGVKARPDEGRCSKGNEGSHGITPLKSVARSPDVHLQE